MQIEVKYSGIIKPKTIFDSPDGTLTVIEGLTDIPFTIRRLYYINNFHSGDSIRGRHAHKRLNQAITCINGHFILSLDDSVNTQKVYLSSEMNCYILLGPGLWHTMEKFSDDCVILVVASDYYDESDYIRSYSEFIEWHNKNEL